MKKVYSEEFNLTVMRKLFVFGFLIVISIAINAALSIQNAYKSNEIRSIIEIDHEINDIFLKITELNNHIGLTYLKVKNKEPLTGR